MERHESLPNSRARLSLDVMNDKLYATCGVCGTTESFYSDCLDILEYKEDSHNWNPVTKLKSGRFSYSSVVVGTGLYILGGFGGARVAVLFLSTMKERIRI